MVKVYAGYTLIDGCKVYYVTDNRDNLPPDLVWFRESCHPTTPDKLFDNLVAAADVCDTEDMPMLVCIGTHEYENHAYSELT